MLRDVVLIDEELCNGCGQCVPACHEGALQIVNGKARLVADRLCDGLGACLGHCPRGAIRIEQRESEAFDAAAVAARQRAMQPTPAPQPQHRGCPGTRFAQFERQLEAVSTAGPEQPSALTHWPVQLRLLSPAAPVLRGAKLLVAADCVPVAYADFHQRFLRDHAVAIACPKLDDTRGYVEKLAEMIAANDLAGITVVHMEVPCCTGILHAVLEARRLAGSTLPIQDVVVTTRGAIGAQREIPADGGAFQETTPASGRDTH